VIMTDSACRRKRRAVALKTRQLSPKIIRILATAFADIEAAIDAVNSGAIYKYVHEPGTFSS